MEALKSAARLAASVSLLALAACGGGGGGGNSIGAPSNNSSGNTSGNSGTPTVSIGAPDMPRVAIQGAPAFNFTTSPPPLGTTLGIYGPAVKITATAVSAAGTDTAGTATYRGTVTSNGTVFPVFDLKIPALSLNATNVRGDATPVTLADGSMVAAAIGTLNYTLLGAWTYTLAGGGTAYIGATATGSGTAPANVPTSGSATYSNSGTRGGAVGAYFVPSGTGAVTIGSLAGDASVTANFASGAVTGTLSNMKATPADGSAATPWNTVSLTGTISRFTSTVAFNGATSTSGAPAGAGTAGFSSAATGLVSGGFFGPNAEEVGATWSLTEPNAAGGGKTAFGALAGAK
jgi:hypothetical protein